MLLHQSPSLGLRCHPGLRLLFCGRILGLFASSVLVSGFLLWLQKPHNDEVLSLWQDPIQ